MSSIVTQAGRILATGGLVIYPTETLYALGCDGRNPAAVDRVFAVKNRPVSKPLPLIVGSWEQFFQLTQPGENLQGIVRMFWPGPLSVLVKIKADLPSMVRDADGWTSVRFTPHPTARELCRVSGAPLVATSANVSGHCAPARVEGLDPALCHKVDGVVDIPPFPPGGLPSTLIRVHAERTVCILRPGALSVSDFHARGITVLDDTPDPARGSR